MCDIYSDAYLAIAASKSENSNGGCYATPHPRFGQTFRFPRTNTGSDEYAVHTRQSLPHINDSEPTDEEKSLFPLLDRAWVFQERILSPRVVHFGQHELLWECMEQRTCQCSRWPEFKSGEYRFYFRKSDMSTTNGIISAEWRWRRIVEQYTTKTLRYDADIFPALQGVAKSLQGHRLYYAGLWKGESLIQDLLWHVAQRNPDRKIGGDMYVSPQKMTLRARPAKWRAPTWSWASVKQPIAFPLRSSRSVKAVAPMVSIHTSPVGPDPFGQLRSGQLQLKGQCISARIRSELKATKTTRADDSVPEYSYHLAHVKAGYRNADFYPDFDLGSLCDRTAYVMELLQWHGNAYSDYDKHSCLVLVRCNDNGRKYERIGCVIITGYGVDFNRDGEEMLLTIV